MFRSLREQLPEGPVVVAHRGDSEHHAENTLPAFAAALALGVTMQEFDVRRTRDGVLLCIHDESFDRTTDAARRFGPGALVAETTFARARELDGARGRNVTGERTVLPTLDEVLDLLLPQCIAMIEHKAGPPADYLAAVRRHGPNARCIVQSFDWNFVAAMRTIAPEIAVALLGPTTSAPRIDAATIAFARSIDAGMVHWSDRAITTEEVRLAHEHDLLVCTYTTDDELGFFGGATMGIDAMCTNRPASMQQLRAAGRLRRGRRD